MTNFLPDDVRWRISCFRFLPGDVRLDYNDSIARSESNAHEKDLAVRTRWRSTAFGNRDMAEPPSDGHSILVLENSI